MSEPSNAADYHVSQIAKANQEAMKYRLKLRELKQQLADVQSHAADLQKAHDAVKAERDDFKGKLDAAPSELQQRLEKLQGEMAARDHRDAWSSVKGQLHDKVSLEKLWSEIGYAPTGEVPDEAKLSEWVGKARDAADYLFKPDPGGSQQAAQAPALKAGPGASRGAPDTVSSRFAVRRAEYSDPEWMRVNQGKVAAAQADGTLVFLD